MACLISPDQHNQSQSIGSASIKQAPFSVLTLLLQRVSMNPCSRILFYLGTKDLLQLRLVSRLSDGEKHIIRSFTERKVRFVVDGTEECNAGMRGSLLSVGWKSVRSNDLDYFQDRAAFRSLAHVLQELNMPLNELSLNFNHLFSHSLDDNSSDESLAVPILKNIEVLNFSDSGIHCNVLYKVLALCHHLKQVDFSKSLAISDAIEKFQTKEALTNSFQKVERLNLMESGITPIPLFRLLLACASLKSLILQQCDYISNSIMTMTDEQVKQVFGQLEELDLAETRITQEALLKIASAKPLLKALSLYDCRNVPGFYEVEDLLKNLRSLNLGRTAIGSRTLINILASCHNLEQLFLTGCTNLSKAIEGFTPEDNLYQVFHRLEVLVLQGTNISEEALSTLLRACRSLRLLDVTDCGALPAALASLTDDEIGLIFGRVWNLSLSGIDAGDHTQLQRLFAQIKTVQILYMESAGLGASFFESCDEALLGTYFAHLKGLFLSSSTISMQALHKCLRISKALEAADLRHVASFAELINSLPIKEIRALLASIKNIWFDESDLSPEMHKKLGEALPRFG